MPCHYIIHCRWNVHWTPRNNGPIRNKVKYNIFVHTKKVGRGHGNDECPSVGLTVRPSRVSDHYLRIIKFGAAFVQFYPSFGQKFMKMTEIYGLQRLSRKIVAQPFSNLECTLVWWTFRINSRLECIGPISAICCKKNNRKWWFFYHYLENLSCLPNFTPLVSKEKWLKMVIFFSFTLNSCNRKNLPRPHCKDAVRSPQLIHLWLICS